MAEFAMKLLKWGNREVSDG